MIECNDVFLVFASLLKFTSLEGFLRSGFEIGRGIWLNDCDIGVESATISDEEVRLPAG